jgi:hypothetical protein
MGSVLGKVTEELPRHDVVKKAASGFYEIRRYAPAVVAETSYATKKGMFEGDQGGSFMRLAKYIGVMAKPQNDTTTAISMTAAGSDVARGRQGGRYPRRPVRGI